MRIKINNKKKHSLGETRIVNKFAWLPVKISKEEYIWLQFYKVKQKYLEEYNFSKRKYERKWV
jgi:hypothetical protein